MSDNDYFGKAVEAGRQRLIDSGSERMVGCVDIVIEAAEPFVRADERSKLEEAEPMPSSTPTDLASLREWLLTGADGIEELRAKRRKQGNWDAVGYLQGRLHERRNIVEQIDLSSNQTDHPQEPSSEAGDG